MMAEYLVKPNSDAGSFRVVTQLNGIVLVAVSKRQARWSAQWLQANYPKANVLLHTVRDAIGHEVVTAWHDFLRSAAR